MRNMTLRNTLLCLSAVAFCGAAMPVVVADETSAATADHAAIARWIKTLQDIGPKGAGNRQAIEAWRHLAQLDAEQLPAILAGLDGANALSANYFRSVVETIAERTTQNGGQLPRKALEAFVLQRSHSPRGRRLAFDQLAAVDSTATARLIPLMLDDPSLELRRDAVAQVIGQAEGQLTSGDKSAAAKTFAKALQAAREVDQVKDIVKQLTKLEQEFDLPAHFGFLTDWKLAGPFDNAQLKGFAVAYPPEKKIDLKTSYDGKSGKFSWIDHATEDDFGIVDLAKALDKHKGAITYATTTFTSDKAQTVNIRLGCINAFKLWVNGKQLMSREIYHAGMEVDQYVLTATLLEGKNVILLKICQNEQTESWAQRWQFQIRVCDVTGTAIHSLDRPARRKKQ